MRYVMVLFATCLLMVICWAQETLVIDQAGTVGLTVLQPDQELIVTEIVIPAASIKADKIVFPFPDQATMITFALADPTAPDPISLVFDYPSTETLAAWQGEVTELVKAQMNEAEQGVRGMGGDVLTDAIKSAYRDEIAEQKDIERKLQRYLNAVVKVRFRLEMLRQMAAQIK